MALRWLEGWEGASKLPAHHSRVYASVTGDGTGDLQESGASWTSGAAFSSTGIVFTTNTLVGSPENSWIIGLAFRPDNSASVEGSAAPYVAVANTDGEQIRFEFANADSSPSKPGGNYYKIRVMRGATELASCTTRFLFANQLEPWIYFEFKVTIDNSTGTFAGRYQHIDKPSINNGGAGGYTTLAWDATNTNVDTQNQTSTGADRFVLSMNCGTGGARIAVDDIYVADSTGTKNNDYIGRIIIEAQKPAGDGTTVQWTLADATSTQDAWDEGTQAQDDDGRVTSDTATQIHLATVDALQAMTGSNTTIVGVRMDVIAHMETAGDLDIAHMWRKTTGTPAQTNSGTKNFTSTAYEGSTVVAEDDPNTATDWDIADLNSYQYGVRNDG